MAAHSSCTSRTGGLNRATALLLASLSACADGTPEQAIVADSAGIRVVANPAPEIPLDWTFTPTLTLGGEEQGPEAFYTVRESTVGVDSAGRIYVLDADGHRLLVFAGDGSHLRTLGREGEGPGEIAWPIGLTVKPDGTALIDDIGRGTVHGFDTEGLALDSHEALVPNNRRIWGGDGYYSAISTLEDDQKLYRFLRVVDADTTELARFTSASAGVVELESCGMALSGLSPLFSPDIVWDAWRDRAVARVGTAYQIDVFDGSTRVARYRRAVEPVKANRDLAARELGEGMRMMTSAGVRECAWDEVIEKRGFAELIPAIRTLRVGPDGRIWVSRGGPRPEPTPTDILTPDGSYVGTLPADAPYPIGFLPDGRMLATERDELDVVRLVVYRVDEQ
ncbi:MAG: hypothetical protein JJE01_15645 [Gemmatimonadetes bacterium]|nr:hypothetical protein [Gemmatimonadota bacterium]